MMRAFLFAAAFALSACATPAPQSDEPSIADTDAQAEQASIPFADFGGIRDWRAGPENSLLIEGRTGHWYRATFFQNCTGLRFADVLAIDQGPGNRVDRFSSVIVDGRRCNFRTLVEIPDPDAAQ
ncbi:MAG: hypothetical protein GC189_06955 [Alphaproteobacteria bacterium]|nr:hypothetical protein [Alphaproteobacteria bacterium]